MKRIAAAVLILCMALFCVCPAGAEEESHAGYFTREAYIRSEKAAKGYILTTIPAYTTVEYLPDGDTGYARAEYNGAEGWLNISGIRVPPEDTALEPFTVYSKENMTLRSLPFDDAAKSDPIYARSMLTVIGESGQYFHVTCLNGSEGYVLKHRVAGTGTLAPAPVKEREVYIPVGTVLTDLPLVYANPRSTVEMYCKHTIRYAYGAYYYIDEDGLTGWMKKADVTDRRMAQGTAIQPMYAVTAADTELFRESGERFPLAAGVPLFLYSDVGSLWGCSVNDVYGYIRKDDVTPVWAEEPLTGYTVTAERPLTVLDFPDAALGSAAGEIPAGTEMNVTAAIRNYLKVSAGDVTGYAAAAADLLSAETALLPLTEKIPRYELALDKKTMKAYAFVLDENGARTDEIAVCALVAIGKNSTPTPTGTFTLTEKSRWHTYTRSYTPYNTAYAPSRYIHGLPAATEDDTDIIGLLAHSAGQKVTGGCLRSPTAFAQWVYLNCSSYITRIVITADGLYVPEGVQYADLSD